MSTIRRVDTVALSATSVSRDIRRRYGHHVSAHGVTLDEVRQAILEHPYWMTTGKNDTTLIYGRIHAGRYLFVVAVDDHGEAFVVTART
jgi:hypothetical protein